jgi:hypothetical protein
MSARSSARTRSPKRGNLSRRFPKTEKSRPVWEELLRIA